MLDTGSKFDFLGLDVGVGQRVVALVIVVLEDRVVEVPNGDDVVGEEDLTTPVGILRLAVGRDPLQVAQELLRRPRRGLLSADDVQRSLVADPRIFGNAKVVLLVDVVNCHFELVRVGRGDPVVPRVLFRLEHQRLIVRQEDLPAAFCGHVDRKIHSLCHHFTFHQTEQNQLLRNLQAEDLISRPDHNSATMCPEDLCCSINPCRSIGELCLI